MFFKNNYQLSLAAITLALIFCSQTTFADGAKYYSPHEGYQVETNPQSHPRFMEMVENLPETWSIWANENLSKENLTNIYAVAAWSAVTLATDYETWQMFREPHLENRSLEIWNYHMVSMGDGYFQFLLAGIWGAYGYSASINRALRTASQIVETITATGAVVQIIKHSTGRESPFQTSTRTGNWEPFPEQVKYHKDVQKYDAVPSGHIATAHATFIVIWENYPEYKWIPYIGYPLISLISVGLVSTSLHWWSDIPLGIALGHSFAKVVTRRNKIGPAKSSSKYVPDLVPMANPSYGQPPLLGLRWQW